MTAKLLFLDLIFWFATLVLLFVDPKVAMISLYVSLGLLAVLFLKEVWNSLILEK